MMEDNQGDSDKYAHLVSEFVAKLHWCAVTQSRKRFLKHVFSSLAEIIPFNGAQWTHIKMGKNNMTSSKILFSQSFEQQLAEECHSLVANYSACIGNVHRLTLFRNEADNSFLNIELKYLQFLLTHLAQSYTENTLRQSKHYLMGHCCAEKSLAKLTHSERQIASLMVAGLTTAQIAESRGRSHRTIEKHMQSIYRKLEVKNKKEAVAMLIDSPKQV